MSGIVASKLSRRFGALHAVIDLDLDVQPGEIFGFLGPNGAGKTTVVRMLCGLLAPSAGRATVAGFDVVQQTRQLKHAIGYMSQKFGLYTDLTVRENVEFFAGVYLSGYREAKRRADEILERLGLASRAGSLAGTLSGGFKQRLALASSIVHGPPIVFLDEPTAGVDPVSRREIWDLIYGLQGQGKTLFVTTHYMEEAERCNRIGFIHSGRLVALGTPASLKATRMGAEVLSLAGPDLYAMYRALSSTAGVLDVTIYGNDIHVVVEEAQAGAALIRARLAEVGLTLTELRPIAPSIEDIFVRLTRTH